MDLHVLTVPAHSAETMLKRYQSSIVIKLLSLIVDVKFDVSILFHPCFHIPSSITSSTICLYVTSWATWSHHGLHGARVMLSVRIADPLSGRRAGS